jgi:hypothetical protein
MNLPAIVTVSATMPLFATIIGEETETVSEDLLAVLHVATAGMLISFAALLDDICDLTSWLGLLPPASLGLF